jgi:hypothetical protein
VYILHNIKFRSQNEYPWMRKIHMVKMMGIFVCTWRITNRSLGRPKHHFSLKMQKAICER